MTPENFISTWKHSDLNERQGAQMHFNALCELLGVPKPNGTSLMDQGYGFEINVDKTGGGGGFADAWKRNCFAWEYKSPGKDLGEALKQLRLYASDLENPPLLIVSDMRRIELHTNWTSMVQEKHVLELDDLADARLRQKLKWAFDEANVEQLKPKRSANATTEEVAKKFVAIAQNLRDQGHDPEKVAHFVNRMVFCMFAEDVDLLPKRLFESMLQTSLEDPSQFVANAESLFGAMANKNGRVGYDAIQWFNGGLFEDGGALPLTADDIRIALEAARSNWSEINPSIMGTLFERGLDPSKRSQLGAHYTDAEKIMMIVRPVIIEPLLREWAEMRAEIEPRMEATRKLKQPAESKKFQEAQAFRVGFLERLRTFRILDPACGSGNFLYLALKALKNIEFRVNFESQELGLPPAFPAVGPECVKGIEINPFAAELARVSVWIGEIQWMREKNFGVSKNPILKPLETIECRDALLNPDGTEAQWPDADVIIGNPPFLGGKMLITNLGDKAVSAMFRTFDGRVPREADLVCYWFQKASEAIAAERITRAGLVATNSIRGGANREVLKHIRTHGIIFNAWGDEPWLQDGAAVRVAIVNFGDSEVDTQIKLDGDPVLEIYPDLTARKGSIGVDLTNARPLPENASIAFMGDTKGGAFEIPGELAREWLQKPVNPNGETNSRVLKPWINGLDVTRRPRDMWIVDFGWKMSEAEAALFEEPFAHILNRVQPERQKNRRETYRTFWWRHLEARQGMHRALCRVNGFIVTPRVAKHRVFVWSDAIVLPDSATIAIIRDDCTTFGILHSKLHELWSLRMCTWLGVGNDPRYTPTTCFETFPFPDGLTPNIPAADYAADPHAQAIATAAARLNRLRENWLNPSDLVQRAPEVVLGYPDRTLPVDDKAAAILKDRTLTKLYNERPTWLDHAHRDLDAAVTAAYGWPADLSDDQILERLFALNQERAARQ
ncbi:class I SAM-dependent DNA methyltransferase [Hyphomicrobium sp.]|uniref:class I SAM-dependent DNA methyltransferase n=1 Tax=Hyphomicrobium sp. TaxID=82 RepID=UPI003F723980